MIYEIGWSAYDIRYNVVPLLCFIPLLILFVLLQKRYDTKKDNEIDEENEKAGYANVRGSKSTTKFMFSAVLVVLMIVSLSPILTLTEKHKNIISYKNGEYEVFTGIVGHIGSYSFWLEEKSQSESKTFSTRRPDEVTDFVEKNIKNGEEYTIYYTYTISEKTGKHIPETILRIDKVQ